MSSDSQNSIERIGNVRTLPDESERMCPFLPMANRLTSDGEKNRASSSAAIQSTTVPPDRKASLPKEIAHDEQRATMAAVLRQGQHPRRAQSPAAGEQAELGQAMTRELRPAQRAGESEAWPIEFKERGRALYQSTTNAAFRLRAQPFFLTRKQDQAQIAPRHRNAAACLKMISRRTLLTFVFAAALLLVPTFLIIHPQSPAYRIKLSGEESFTQKMQAAAEHQLGQVIMVRPRSPQLKGSF